MKFELQQNSQPRETAHEIHLTGHLIVPFITTSKPILRPILNDNGEINNLIEIPFTLYAHSPNNANMYDVMLGNHFDIGIFVCSYNNFDEFADYITKLTQLTFEKMIKQLTPNPEQALIQDYNELASWQSTLFISKLITKKRP